MARAITDATAEVVAGDCHLANGAIRQETGRDRHPPPAATGPGLRDRARARRKDPGCRTHLSRSTLDDIADLRAYEHEREDFRARIIELKKRRRVPVGPVVSLVFESRDTVRFQVQEMARAERHADRCSQIQQELDTYNPLIPGPGRLAATLFIELTTKVRAARNGCPGWSASNGPSSFGWPGVTSPMWSGAGWMKGTPPSSPGRRSPRPSTTYISR